MVHPAAPKAGHRDRRGRRDRRGPVDSRAAVRSPGAGGHSRRVGDIPVADGPPAGGRTPWEVVAPFLRGEDNDVEEDVLVVGAHVAAPHVVAAHTPAAAVHSRSRGAVAHSPAAADRGHRGPAVDSRSHGAGSRAAAGSRGAADTQNRPAVDSRGADRHLEVDDRMAVDVVVDVRIQQVDHGDLVDIRHV